MRSRELWPKSIFDAEEVEDAFAARGIPLRHAQRVANAVARFSFAPSMAHLSLENDFRYRVHIPGLPQDAYEILERDFVPLTSRIEARTDAADFSTSKLLIRLQDGQKIEAVIMRYGQVEVASYPAQLRAEIRDCPAGQDTSTGSFKSKKRATLCVSSQIGCAMKCTFCATGTMGLQGNLTPGEILEQLALANKQYETDVLVSVHLREAQ